MTKRLKSFVSHARQLEAEPDFVPSLSKYPFSEQQRVIIDFLLKGFGYFEVAGKLNLAEGTVKDHCTRIFKIAGVSNRHQFMAKFLGAAKI
jgi:DNA-binding NarL/FixJ family response regulator